MNKVAPVDYEASALSLLPASHPPATHLHSPSQNLQNYQGRTCKICLQEELPTLHSLRLTSADQAKGLQLLMPCECSGSVGFVHEKCLKTWLCKQLGSSGKRQAFCEICKSQIHFKLKKTRHCEVEWQHLSLVSGCNVLSALVQVFLLALVVLVWRYSLGLQDSALLCWVLLVLACVLSLTACFTLALMASEAFIKTRQEITQILSIHEAEALGLRELKLRTSHHLPNPTGSASSRSRLADARHQLPRTTPNAQQAQTAQAYTSL